MTSCYFGESYCSYYRLGYLLIQNGKKKVYAVYRVRCDGQKLDGTLEEDVTAS